LTLHHLEAVIVQNDHTGVDSGGRACDGHIRTGDIANALDVDTDFDLLPQVLLNRPGLCWTLVN
jgi:hypothetical protein